MRINRRFAATAGLMLGLAVVAGGCTSIRNHRGYIVDKTLVEAIQPGLLRMAILVGLVAFVFGGLVIVSVIGMLLGFWVALGAGIAAGYFYYDRKRETVYVRDLMHGRYFSCRSVIELARKEAWLGTIVAYLRQVMESAKHWDGTEAVSVPVLSKEDAKELIVRGL